VACVSGLRYRVAAVEDFVRGRVYYVRFTTNADHTFTQNVATNNYDDHGRQPVVDSRATYSILTGGTMNDVDWQNLAVGRVILGLGDNYADVRASLTIGEAKVLLTQ